MIKHLIKIALLKVNAGRQGYNLENRNLSWVYFFFPCGKTMPIPFIYFFSFDAIIYLFICLHLLKYRGMGEGSFTTDIQHFDMTLSKFLLFSSESVCSDLSRLDIFIIFIVADSGGYLVCICL